MDATSNFYQTLTGTSFTLLGLWLTIMQLSHGGWRTDPVRHRATIHIALHFFLPGVLGMFSLLTGVGDGGVLWRTTFVIGGGIGLIEALACLRAGALPHGRIHAALSQLDPALYLAVIVAAFVPPRTVALTPLQIEGMTTGLLFVSGLCSAWLAFAEREVPGPPPPSRGAPGSGQR